MPVETAKWFLPKQKLSDKAVDLFDNIRGMFKTLLDMKIEFEYFKDNGSVQEQVAGHKNSVMFVSVYEAIYLNAFYDFMPLFRLKSSAHEGLLTIPKDSPVKHIGDLAGQTIVIPKGIDLACINPIIMYLVKNCKVNSMPKSFLIYSRPEFHIDQLLKSEVAAILLNSFDYGMLTESEQKKLKILGRFPIESDFTAIAGPDFAIGKFRQKFDGWLKIQKQECLKDGFMYAPIERSDDLLLIEAIEGLGYNLKDFIEQYSDLIIKTITNNQAEDFKILHEKYNGLQVFNEKLVNMYKEVRESRDRLYKEIDSTTDNTILFLKVGTILGTSRGFLHWVHLSRPDIIGKNIADLIAPNMNKTFRELIQQIDYGLIKSFGVKLVKENGADNLAKMDFTIIELQDSKIILGIIGKKAGK